jgi:hypothetical protein
MSDWTFKVFIKANGRDAFEEWIEDQNAEAEESIRAMIRRLSNTRFELWGRPLTAQLRGHQDIYEILVPTKDKQYRPLGCFGPGPQVFTLLVGASKKGNVWTPPNARETADKRCKLVYKDWGRYTREYQPRPRGSKKTP